MFRTINAKWPVCFLTVNPKRPVQLFQQQLSGPIYTACLAMNTAKCQILLWEFYAKHGFNQASSYFFKNYN